jgi:EPS-associated MarR family transcriptional regulator
MSERILENETLYNILRLLETNSGLSQRELVKEFGISLLGKVNYCLKALLNKGYIKAGNFKNSRNKRGYLYQLTPAGLKAKSKTTQFFLACKQAEDERLVTEIEKKEPGSCALKSTQDHGAQLAAQKAIPHSANL